eukprot:jgi/Tetstr1/437684/TSEL_000242.t1
MPTAPALVGLLLLLAAAAGAGSAPSQASCVPLQEGARAVLRASFEEWLARRGPVGDTEAEELRRRFMHEAECGGGGDGGGGSGGGGVRSARGRHVGLREGAPVEVEVGHLGTASQSSTAAAGGVTSPAAAALDGLTLGFQLGAHEAAAMQHRLYPVARTRAEAAPWWRLQLPGAALVTAVEAWPARAAGEAITAAAMQAHQADAMSRKEPKPGKGKGKGGKGKDKDKPSTPIQELMAEHSADHPPLRFSLFDDGGGAGAAAGGMGAGAGAGAAVWSATVEAAHTWRSEGGLRQPARVLRVDLPLGGAAARPLTLAEVKVHALVPWECDRYCVHGDCRCAQPPGADGSACEATVCECHPDWVGRQCDTFLLSAWEYLPPKDHLGDVSWWEDEGRSAALTAALHSRQHPLSCPPTVAGYPKLMQSGLGSTLMLTSAALSDAFVQGLPFQPPPSVQFARDV